MLSFLLALSDLDSHDRLLHIYSLYHNKFIKYARAVLNSSNRTYNEEDAVQNLYWSVLKYSDRIRCWDNEKELYAYLITMLLHECRNVQRSAQPVEDIDEYACVLVSDDDFVSAANEVTDYNRLVETIQSLDDIYRIPLHLRWVEGMSTKEISRRLNIPIKTVYTQLNRGKYLLKIAWRKRDDNHFE